MWGTPVGSEFRDMITLWEDAMLSQDRKNQIRMLVDGQNLILFFTYEDQVYGAHEPQRVSFARLKDPDDETPEGWAEEANFTAINLTRAITGKPEPHIFYKEDIPKIEVIDKDMAASLLYDEAANQQVAPNQMAHGMKQMIQIIQSKKNR